MSIYAKEFLAIYYALNEFVHVFWGMRKPTMTLTDNKSVRQFFHSTIIPPPLWNACDYMIQFSFIIADIPGTNQHSGTLYYLSRLEMDPIEKFRQTNQIMLQQSKDPSLLHLKVEIQKEEYS